MATNSNDPYRSYYSEKLEQGQEFQDFIAQKLLPLGLMLNNFSSRHFQYKHGENLLGMEIKRDGKFRETGRLYIEFAEKAHPTRADFTASGIDREDNAWLFLIGDEQLVWIFSTKILKLIAHRFEQKQTPTSKGFVMPLADADKYCLRRIAFTNGERVSA